MKKLKKHRWRVMVSALTAMTLLGVNVPAQAVDDAKTSIEQLVSTQTGLSVSLVQNYISQGYTPEEIQSAFAIANSSNVSLDEVLSNSHKTIATVDQVPDPVNQLDTVQEARGVNSLVADAGATNGMGTSAVELPDLRKKLDEAPYKVNFGTANLSTLSGGVSFDAVDMTLVGVHGLDFHLTRSYNSDSSAYDDIDFNVISNTNHTKKSYQEKMYPIGIGWSWNLPSIEWDPQTNRHYLHLAGGGTYEINNTHLLAYPWNRNLSVIDGEPLELFGQHNSEVSILKSMDDGISQYFSWDGYLLQITDAYNNNIQFRYDEVYPYGKVLVMIKSSNNNTINISYSSSEVRLTQGSSTVVYTKEDAYNGHELLTSVRDEAGRVTKYGYTVAGAKFNVFDDVPDMWNPYALLTQINHPTGVQTRIQYEDTPYKRYLSTRIASVKEVYRVKSIENQITYTDGSKTSYNKSNISYVGDMGAPPYTSETGSFSTIIDDGLTKTTYDFEKERGVAFYNSKITTVDKSNPTTSMVVTNTYDRERMRPIPNTVSKQYVTSAGMSNPIVTSRTYDDFGHILTETDPMNVTKTYTYNGAKLASVTEPVSDSVTKLTSFVYNDKNSVIQETTTTAQQPSTILAQTKYAYDSYGNMVEVRTLDGDKEIVQTSEYKQSFPYRGAFLTSTTQKVTNIDNQVSTVSNLYDYDTVLGQPTKWTDGNGNATTYQYDLLGRLQKQTNPDNSTVTLTYDDLNNRIEQVNEMGQKSRVQWNPLGLKLKTEVYQNGQYKAVSKNDYDLYSRLVVEEDGENHQTINTYDNFGRIIQKTFADSTKETYQYNDLSHYKTVIDPDHNSFLEVFDKMDRSIAKLLVKSPTELTAYERHSYDNYGNLVSVTDGNNNQTTYQYDALKRLTLVTDALQQSTAYKYDQRNNLTQITYSDGTSVQKKYDELGRLIQQTDALNQVTKNYYDANGNLILQKDRNNQAIQVQYNSRNQLVQKAVGTNAIKFEYDLSGHRTKMADETGSTRYAYDEIGQLSSVTYPDGKSIGYTYNGNGQVATLKEPFGKTYVYSMDLRNRVQGVFSGSSLASAYNDNDITYGFTNGGSISKATLANGYATESSYNEYKYLTTMTQRKGNNKFYTRYGYSYDNANNQISKEEDGTTYNFAYDKLNRISSSSQNNESYAYDSRGNRSTLQSDQLTLPTAATYEYDVWNQLKKVTTTDNKVVTYKYDGDGLMTERTENGVTTRYYYDGLMVKQEDQGTEGRNAFPVNSILSEAKVTNGNPDLVARYIRNSNGALIAREDATDNKVYYLFNGHGDVTEIRDREGNLLNAYTYDIWGNPTSVTEKVANPFRYSGEFWDSTTGLQYLRARWYDPGQGRFITEDTYQGEKEKPLTLNYYTYVENNPLRYTDPTGHRSMDEPGGGSNLGPVMNFASSRNVVRGGISRSQFPSGSISGKEVVKFLKKEGFDVVSQSGSHVKLKGTDGKVVIVPVHGNKDLPIGTLNSIKKQSGYK